MDEEEIYKIVNSRRVKMGLTQAEVSRRAFGREDTGAIQHLRRGKSPTARTLSALCSALGLEFYIGPPRGNVEPLNLPYKPPPIDEEKFFACVEGLEKHLKNNTHLVVTPKRKAKLLMALYDYLIEDEEEERQKKDKKQRKKERKNADKLKNVIRLVS